ncbi:Thioredoxin reductase [Caloramator quimbayensis]|uniref:Thioredoxin reductase n=1 Tax=Caloramator quimbayensis TaxID=1147123 RepID=A0A1T4YG65_9CLOT|nr:FAD-dependent oxidoreductase [Caloramator quimbayensis]SKB00812.1 Thioredoxin reductase [Caloramator quimbayensis]
MEFYDVVVLGAGPAGLAAGLSSYEEGANTLIIEREKYPGGILKQCIHDGFGLVEFKERLTGPEYAERFIKMVRNKKIPILTSTFVTSIKKEEEIFILSVVSKDGIIKVGAKAIILANGCRERTSKQIGIHGTRPSGVMTAGLAQYFVNIMGYLPCKKCIILGSGDIGLIMARRLTLEGAKVLGVYEVKNSPSGLTRNIVQCLNDFSIPLYLSKTITKISGDDRVEGVEICDVDENMKPIKGTEKFIECDGVILSVGLIPENEIAESLNVEIDNATKGPYVDQNFMTKVDGIFSCGNALHVNDLVDYVTESGRLAGKSAAKYASSKYKRALNPIEIPLNKFLYAVPQYIDINSDNNKVVMYLRSRDIVKNVKVIIKSRNEILYEKRYTHLNPPEMERIVFDFNRSSLNDYSIKILMQEG